MHQNDQNMQTLVTNDQNDQNATHDNKPCQQDVQNDQNMQTQTTQQQTISRFKQIWHVITQTQQTPYTAGETKRNERRYAHTTGTYHCTRGNQVENHCISQITQTYVRTCIIQTQI